MEFAVAAAGVVLVSAVMRRLKPAPEQKRLSAEGGSIVDPHPETEVWTDCVHVVQKPVKGATAVAARAFKKGELVEKGLMRRMPPGFKGEQSEYVFTWNKEQRDRRDEDGVDNNVWAVSSGS